VCGLCPASMNWRRRVVLYVCLSVIFSNCCENLEDQKLAQDDTKNALVAMGTEDDDEDASVEGLSVFD